jgi:hypothetical protein
MEDSVPREGAIETRVMHRQGMSNKTIGKFGISLDTVRRYIRGNVPPV